MYSFQRPKFKKTKKETAQSETPEKIVAWRWKEVKGVSKKARQREYLVKFRQRSWWSVVWLSEEVLNGNRAYFPMKSSFLRKNDIDTEPQRLQIDSNDVNYNRIVRMAPGVNMMTKILQNSFYQFGVRPEWLIVHRVINHHETNAGTEYFVKWRDLDYTNCTWERENKQIPNLEAAIDYYKSHRAISLSLMETGNQIPKFYVPPAEPTSDLKVKLEQQPACVDETGLQLFKYQLDGLNWLRHKFAEKIPCILGESNKTSIISFILSSA